MNVKVADLMVSEVVTATSDELIGNVKKTMNRFWIDCLPVVDDDQSPIGVLTSSDVLTNRADGRAVEHYMTRKLFTIPKYAEVSQAARIMRKHGIHHLIVTHEQKVVGILSSYDLLEVLDSHRFTARPAPASSGKPTGRRGKNDR